MGLCLANSFDCVGAETGSRRIGFEGGVSSEGGTVFSVFGGEYFSTAERFYYFGTGITGADTVVGGVLV